MRFSVLRWPRSTSRSEWLDAPQFMGERANISNRLSLQCYAMYIRYFLFFYSIAVAIKFVEARAGFFGEAWAAAPSG